MTIVWSTASDGPINWPPHSDAARAWSTIVIGGLTMPGTCRVNGTGSRWDLQIKKTPGMNGATITDLGRLPAKFTATLVLACQADLDGFESMLPALQPTRKSDTTGKQELEAVTVSHPALNVVGVTSCKIEHISVPHPGSVIGTYEVDLECLEFRAPKDMGASGTATKDVRDWEAAGGGFFSAVGQFSQNFSQDISSVMVNTNP